MWREVVNLSRGLALGLFVVFVSVSPAAAQHRLCEPAAEDCRQILIDHIRAEKVGLDVAFWFMEDPWLASEVINRWKANVPVRVLVDTEANNPNPLNALRLAELEAAGIPMRERVASGILHWKMMLFAGQNIVQFSGANYSPEAWTPSAAPYTNYVDEAILFTSDASIVNSFKTRYDDLWTNTTSYANYRNIAGALTRRYATYPIDPRLNFVPYESHFWRSRDEYLREPSAIDVTMYRITDWRFSREMIQAKQRGLRVRLLTEPQQYRDVRRLWHSYNVDLLYMNGVEIKHRVHAGLNHQKSVILRGLNTAILGSSNWSSPSAEYQEEHNLFTNDATIYQWLVDQFERKWNNSTGITEYGPFTPLPPDRPGTPTPATGTENVPIDDLTLKWDAGPWAHRYDVYLGKHPAEMERVAADIYLGPSEWVGHDRSFQLTTPLTPGTTYYWRIVSRTMANLTAAGPLWTFRTAGTAPPLPPVTLVRHPYVQQVTPTSAIVVWATAENGTARVRFSSPGGDLHSTLATTTLFSAATTGLAADYFQHVAVLTGLAPSTVYTYDTVVSDRDVNAQVDTLTTPPATGTGTVRFVAWGDSGTGSPQQQQIAARIASETFDFGVHGGDLAYGNPGGTGGATFQTMADWFFTTYQSILRARPIYPSIGNHDSRASNFNGRPYLGMFVLPEHGATATYPDHAERYYSFDYGRMHVVVLDTELAFQDPARRAAQLAWLDADLAATTQPWKVAVFHRSPYSAGGEHGSDLAVREAFTPIFENRGVQLVLSAHEHDYERTLALRNGAPAADGITYIVTGGGGAPLYPAGTASWTAHSASVHHYVRGTASECAIRVEAVGLDGAVFDATTIRRCDNEAPTASISAPSAGASVAGSVNVMVNAVDDDAVARVEVLVNGTVIGTDTTAPYAVAWNTNSIADGSYTLTARAYDLTGNTVTSAAVTVTVDNPTPPTISSIGNQTIDEDTSTRPLTFTIADQDTPVGALVVRASSSNTALVPNANLVLGGSGGHRTITVTPAANAFGTATITLTVADGGFTTSTAFTVSVRVPPPPGETGEDNAPNTPPALDADGRLDIVWQHATTGEIAAWNMDGASLFDSEWMSPQSVRMEWKIRAAADFNRDGKPDMVFQHTDGSVALWFMDGTTLQETRLPSIAKVADTNWQIVAAADMNADLNADMIWQHRTTGDIAVWLMWDHQVRETRVIARVNPAWRLAAAGDLTGDNSPDLVFQRTDGTLAAWLMTGLTARATHIISTLSDTGWEVKGIRDINADLRGDLIFQHRTDGRLATWFMSDSRVLETRLLTPNRIADINWRIVGVR